MIGARRRRTRQIGHAQSEQRQDIRSRHIGGGETQEFQGTLAQRKGSTLVVEHHDRLVAGGQHSESKVLTARDQSHVLGFLRSTGPISRSNLNSLIMHRGFGHCAIVPEAMGRAGL
jgi:hypothetical protein